MMDMKELLEKLRSAPPKEAEVEYEGVKFRLRELRSASELARVQQKIRMLPAVAKVKVSDGREVEVHRDVATAIKWVEACLVEPKLSEVELVELSELTGNFIMRLAEKAMEVCGLLSLSELEDFFARLLKGESGAG